MTTLKELHEIVSQCGNVLRGTVEVGGKEFRVECDMGKTHIQIIDENGSCETGEIDAEGDVILQGGECVTADWASAEWLELTAFVGAKSERKSVNEINGTMLVMVECGGDTLELTAQTLIDNGFGSRLVSNEQNAGPILGVGEEEFETLRNV